MSECSGTKILIIEDSRDVNELLRETLSGEGYEVTCAYDGISGREVLESGEFDLLLLDIMLPYLSGDEILRKLRKTSDIPVMVLSAKDMVSTKIDMIKLGADDYLTKPFDLGEVAVRVEALLRRTQKREKEEQTLVHGNLTFFQDRMLASVNGTEIDLTTKELKILQLFLLNKNKVFSKANIYETVWGEEYLGDDNTIKAHLSNLRSKIKKENQGKDCIETVWGIGYRLSKEI